MHNFFFGVSFKMPVSVDNPHLKFFQIVKLGLNIFLPTKEKQRGGNNASVLLIGAWAQ